MDLLLRAFLNRFGIILQSQVFASVLGYPFWVVMFQLLSVLGVVRSPPDAVHCDRRTPDSNEATPALGARNPKKYSSLWKGIRNFRPVKRAIMGTKEGIGGGNYLMARQRISGRG
jgi:hypothetical protein